MDLQRAELKKYLTNLMDRDQSQVIIYDDKEQPMLGTDIKVFILMHYMANFYKNFRNEMHFRMPDYVRAALLSCSREERERVMKQIRGEFGNRMHIGSNMSDVYIN